ncbi:MAG: signal peptidase II [Deltaproteobacteria bacterium]|nr:signal peptidase II [Deltaproteobacteria bacterium]
MKRYHLLFIFTAAAVIVLDQASKFIISGLLENNGVVTVIEGFLNLVHVRNRGMAFGLMNRPDPGIAPYLLMAVTIIAVVLILIWSFRLRLEDRRLLFGLSLILGGAVGNLIDRIRLREVIDFLDVYIGAYHWPAFNVADSAITVGTCWIAVCILFLNKKENTL